MPKICKIVVYFEVPKATKKLRQLEKNACSTSETKQNVLLHMSWLTLKLATQ